MFGGRTSEIKSALENMWELFMKGDLSTVMFGRKTLGESTEVVFLLQEDFSRENKYYESFN